MSYHGKHVLPYDKNVLSFLNKVTLFVNLRLINGKSVDNWYLRVDSDENRSHEENRLLKCLWRYTKG